MLYFLGQFYGYFQSASKEEKSIQLSQEIVFSKILCFPRSSVEPWNT